jgi:hypothetical protein
MADPNSYYFKEVLETVKPNSEYLPNVLPEQKGFIHPIQDNPNNFYRALDLNDYYTYGPFGIEGKLVESKPALTDIYRSGAIRGTENFARGAYFNEGRPALEYRRPFDWNDYRFAAEHGYKELKGHEKNIRLLLKEGRIEEARELQGLLKKYPRELAVRRQNMFIEVSPSFVKTVSSGNNPLYESFFPDMYNYHEYRVLRPELSTFEANKLFERREAFSRPPYGNNMEVVTKPPSFLDRINPKNRSGIRITTTDPVAIQGFDTNGLGQQSVYRAKNPNAPLSPEILSDFEPVRTSSGDIVYRRVGQHNGSYVIPSELESVRTTSQNPNTDVIYDRITPVKERTLGQHAKNALFEAKVLLNQPEIAKPLQVAGTTAKVAVGAAGVLGYASEVMDKGPVVAALAWGVPFTRLRMGIGPVNTLGAPERAPERMVNSSVQDDIDYILHGPMTPAFRGSSGDLIPTPRTIPNEWTQR